MSHEYAYPMSVNISYISSFIHNILGTYTDLILIHPSHPSRVNPGHGEGVSLGRRIDVSTLIQSHETVHDLDTEG